MRLCSRLGRRSTKAASERYDLIPSVGPGPAWSPWAAGAVTAAIGILYALRERDIKRFLAYSTIENTGMIATASAWPGLPVHPPAPALYAFLLIAGLYHVANHGCYKTLLFLEAGVVEHTTGTRDMDRLGGLVHRLPRSTVITFVGTLGIAALPPLNGFVSEWLIFQGLFQGFRTGSNLIAILIVLAAATLGLTGGLAIYAFVRGFGIPYLGMPRTRPAADARKKASRSAGPALLAVACAALAVGAPVMLAALSRTARTITGGHSARCCCQATSPSSRPTRTSPRSRRRTWPCSSPPRAPCPHSSTSPDGPGPRASPSRSGTAASSASGRGCSTPP